MGSSRKPPGPLPPWVDPVWSSDTPVAREEQLRLLKRAQAHGSVLFRIVRGEDVRAELAKQWAEAEAMEALEQEANEAWVSAMVVERERDKRRSRLALLGTVVFVLGVLCGVVLAILRLR